MRRARRMLLLVLATLAAGYVAIVLLVFARQRDLLYFPPPPSDVEARAPVEPLRVAYEGGSVPAFHLPAREGRPTLAWFHGNAESIVGLVPLARLVHAQAGIGFLAAEYPGYGTSAGEGTSERAILASARAALRALEGRGVARDRIVLVGRSLGTGVAVRLATEGLGARLVLVSPYTSIADRAAELYPWIPVRPLVRDRFDSLALAPAVRIPTLVVVGERDTVIPAAMSRTLVEAIAGARGLAVPDAGHDDVLDAPEVLDALLRFAAAPDPAPRGG